VYGLISDFLTSLEDGVLISFERECPDDEAIAPVCPAGCGGGNNADCGNVVGVADGEYSADGNGI